MSTLLYNYYFSIIIIIFSETEGEHVRLFKTIRNQNLLEFQEMLLEMVDHLGS